MTKQSKSFKLTFLVIAIFVSIFIYSEYFVMQKYFEQGIEKEQTAIHNSYDQKSKIHNIITLNALKIFYHCQVLKKQLSIKTERL